MRKWIEEECNSGNENLIEKQKEDKETIPFEDFWKTTNCKVDEAEKALKAFFKQGRNTASGPDGIPYSAYRNAKGVSKSVLLRVWQDLLETDNLPPDNFNYAIMACLPKKIAGLTPT